MVLFGLFGFGVGAMGVLISGMWFEVFLGEKMYLFIEIVRGFRTLEYGILGILEIFV